MGMIQGCDMIAYLAHVLGQESSVTSWESVSESDLCCCDNCVRQSLGTRSFY
jgi:hypothetical protein